MREFAKASEQEESNTSNNVQSNSQAYYISRLFKKVNGTFEEKDEDKDKDENENEGENGNKEANFKSECLECKIITIKVKKIIEENK